MTRCFALLAFLSLITACTENSDQTQQKNVIERKTATDFFSTTISDSLALFINLPNDYNPQQKEKKYPVVYLLDANLYFDIVATIIDKYSEVGLAPSVILIGIGYKDFRTMDSLRNRDYTYPVAIPEYEMTVSGGADKFLQCITSELIPLIDKNYHSDTSKRVLAGHSLGGYFSAYALLQHLSGNSNYFMGYVAASPSMHYNHYFLLKQFKETAQKIGQPEKMRAYFTFGGLEEEGIPTDPGEITQSSVLKSLSEQLAVKQSGCLVYKSDVFSNLGHMETQIPTFIKGLQWILSEDE